MYDKPLLLEIQEIYKEVRTIELMPLTTSSEALPGGITFLVIATFRFLGACILFPILVVKSCLKMEEEEREGNNPTSYDYTYIVNSKFILKI
jgi:hypothetical protein